LDIRKARQADLLVYLRDCRGLEVRREDEFGNWRLVGHDGVVFRQNFWHQFGSGKRGNSLDLVVRVLRIPFTQAVKELREVPSVNRADESARFPAPGSSPSLSSPAARLSETKSSEEENPHRSSSFQLPKPARDHSRVVDYLTRQRKLPLPVVAEVTRRGLLYESVQGGCCFVCHDYTQQPRAAVLRGTSNDFKGFVAGSDSSYGWWLPPLSSSRVSGLVVVTESAIDALSLAVLCPGFRRQHLLALNGLRATPLVRFLDDHPEVRVVLLALDNDPPGRDAVTIIRERLTIENPSLSVGVLTPPGPGKDWGDALAAQSETAPSHPEGR
jgi:hypothetical protein